MPIVTVERIDGGWKYTREMVEPTGIFYDDYEQTDEEVFRFGPPELPSNELEKIARGMGREPSEFAWYREQVLVERIAADDLDGAKFERVTPEYLTLAIESKAWKVAAALVERGAPLVAPPNTVWKPIDFLIARLDDNGLRLLDMIDLKPLDGLLREARTPGVVRKLVALGASVEAIGPAGHSAIGPELDVATPLMVAVQLERFDVATALLEAGARLDTRDALGRTPLEFAIWWGKESSIAWLRQRANH